MDGAKRSSHTSPGRVTLALYNTYDPNKFLEVHRRAIARIAPLATAFDFNLAFFGFPHPPEMKTAPDICRWVADSTTIGEGGKYLTDLAEKGRVAFFPFIKKGFPPQLGLPVITTRRPDPEREITAEKLAALIRRGQSALLVFGLGPKGLPSTVRNAGAYHLDITGNRTSLETCTAMGAVAGVMWRDIMARGRQDTGEHTIATY